MSLEKTADRWWKNAIFYCLDVEVFADSDGDGIGDFAGLTEKVDYLAGLGATCLWLMPFYPSPGRDDGYDVADYYAIDERLGTFGDFTQFMRTARDRGLRVIADLVVNHTSTEHPWFQAARSDRNSPYREFCVWRDEIPENGPEGVVFPGEQEGVWTWDEQAGQYFLHRFYPHQPDLNIASERVREEIRKVMGFWLAQGLSGFRVDAVPFLLETSGIDGDPMEIEPHDYLRDLRAFLNRRDGDAILLGEVNLEPGEARKFFGDENGDEMHMLFNFTAMQNLYLSLTREDARPLAASLRRLPPLPDGSQWGTFVRNHDELTLDKLDESEREEVFDRFGPEARMQIYGRGLRRRLPPMLDGDRAMIRMVYSLLLTLPGAPCIFYGEEIGMGENLDIEGRLSVRTPMQWNDDPSAGFSAAPREQLVRPVVDAPGFDPQAVNVAAQEADIDSLLNWFERMFRLRRETPEIGWGDRKVLNPDHRGVLALRYDWEGRVLICLHNLTDRPRSVTLMVGRGGTRARDRLTGALFDVTEEGELSLELPSHGHVWLRVT